MMLFGYFCQDNCDIGLLAGGLDIRVQYEWVNLFHSIS